jgi:hypothetical protein
MVRDNPIFGVGAGYFGVAYGSRYADPGDTGPWHNAHSIYFQIIGELGIPGIAALLWCIFGNLLENQKVLRAVRARNPDAVAHSSQVLASTSAAMIALAVGGAFLSAVYYPHIYMVAALMTAARRVAQRQAEQGAGATAPAAAERQVTVHWALQPPPRPALPATGDTRTPRGRHPGAGALKRV